ncbi:MAG: type II toxin-antitoxin system HipA family toxin [Butyrivibrio sp.]|nr:type II toxin-antitoxin system HipA family toxin [Butyrivibrio sp.]
MREFEVHAGWLDPAETIGICRINTVRGNEVISFSYDVSWLQNHPSFNLDPDVQHAEGWQYPPADKPSFGFLADTAPDRWGRKLMDRREGLDAELEHRAKRKLMESDYILGVHDGGRIGGIRFYDPQSGVYLSSRDTLAAPPMEQLGKLEQASLALETEADEDVRKWLKNLLDPGSSLGGARPKANVVDEKGNVWIAKFPSAKDEMNIGAWEMVAHELAIKCGLNVPDARLLHLSEKGDTFLVKRFDRDGEKRIHYASAMTMLGATDRQDNQMSYIDIVDVIEGNSNEPQKQLKELWDRLVFNVCISNTDDHLRNHGFLLRNDGWDLSPAFDVNPNIDKDTLSLLIGETDEKSVENAIAVCEFFRISEEDARKRAGEIKRIVRENWKELAKAYHIANQEIVKMSDAFAAAST